MYTCYVNDVAIGKAKTEEVAQKICKKLGSYYVKNKFNLFFWKISKDTIINTTFGFLSYKEVMEKIRDIIKEKYNTTKRISLEEAIPIFEEIFGDYTYTFFKRKLDKYIRDHISV
jgi:hypothetical protein